MTTLPTVGRMVHYYDCTWQKEPIAAVVTWVDGSNVKLTLLRPGDAPHAMSTRVPFSEEPKDCCWSWPPRV